MSHNKDIEYSELTQSQLTIWTGQKMNPEAPLYNMAHSFDISGPLYVQKFQTAFQELINRADALRTIFTEIDSIPYQSVLQNIPYHIEVVDFTTIDEMAIQDWIEKRSQQPFDLSKPLFDSILIKVNEKRHIWFLNVHHLITDATSSTILYDIMSKLYGHLLTNSLKNTKEIPLFSSYVLFEKQERSNENIKASQSYWHDRIKSLKNPPKLYGKKNSNSTTRAKRVSVKLGVDRSNKLRELAQRTEIRSWTQHLTLFNLFITTLFSFSYRVSGQKKLAIGTPSHNRPTKNFKQTPGLFIEFYPLVIDFEEHDTFLKVFERIKLETNNYLRYAQPGVSNAEISRSFNVVLNYINASFSQFDGLPMNSEWIHPGHCDAAHDLRCHVYDMDASGNIEIHFDLNTDVFHDALIKKVPNHFLNVLDALIHDIDQTVQQPPLVTDEEANGILLQPQKSNSKFTSILDQFDEQAKKMPSSIAVRHKETMYTYEELNNKINQLAHHLATKGIEPEKRVALYIERSPEYIIGVLAVLKIGATFIPISSDQPIQRVSFILKDANCSLVLTNDSLQHNLIASSVETISLDVELEYTENQNFKSENITSDTTNIAYIIYTSGSTGNPKGVLISHTAISNYLNWAKEYYATEDKFIFPLFTAIGFDLTVTATFLPLVTGGELVVYKESNTGPDVSLIEVLEENRVNSIKLTPSHLALIQGDDYATSRIKTMIVGGENFKTKIASAIQKGFGSQLRVFNEYGPTEATIGCLVSKFDINEHTKASVPIGLPITGTQAYIFDDYMNLVPEGVIGSLYISGAGLADGYLSLPELTSKKFIDNPFDSSDKLYQTGDLTRINSSGDFEYLGRIDEQIKLGGFRIELADIEANILKHDSVENTAVVLIENEKRIPENEVINCSECGLPSNYPNTDFDKKGVCHICNAFKGYKNKAQRYFKTEDELKRILTSQKGKNPRYDCISLLSGGKDSTYILAQLVDMGLNVLAFTLDNGYISGQAKANIDKVVKSLGVDHIYGQTQHMNKIFIDSLNRHQNVCDGCFKTIYTLSTNIALEKKIPFVVTGLSRGQFFETRLTEELFWNEDIDVSTIDETILEARKLYHQEEDAVKKHLDVSMFDYNDTFNKVQFVDFYRYSDVSLEEMLIYLKEKIGWVRPTDTGRSTNCLINQVGIYVHKKEKGYSNYSFPYSWDVRMGHKTRSETLEEINEVIDEKEVKRIMNEIGYQESNKSDIDRKRLVGYYTGKQKISSKDLANHLKKELPDYMVPTYFKFIDELPLTSNGKVDKVALKTLNSSQLEMETPFVTPNGEIQSLLANIWKEVLQLKQVGIHDDFIALGGHSLAAIRVTARINEEVEMKFPLNKIFELPTIADYAKYIEETLIALLEN